MPEDALYCSAAAFSIALVGADPVKASIEARAAPARAAASRIWAAPMPACTALLRPAEFKGWFSSATGCVVLTGGVLPLAAATGLLTIGFSSVTATAGLLPDEALTAAKLLEAGVLSFAAATGLSTAGCFLADAEIGLLTAGFLPAIAMTAGSALSRAAAGGLGCLTGGTSPTGTASSSAVGRPVISIFGLTDMATLVRTGGMLTCSCSCPDAADVLAAAALLVLLLAVFEAPESAALNEVTAGEVGCGASDCEVLESATLLTWRVLVAAEAAEVGCGGSDCEAAMRGLPVAVTAAQITGFLALLPGTGLPAASAGVLGLAGNAAAAAEAADAAVDTSSFGSAGTAAARGDDDCKAAALDKGEDCLAWSRLVAACTVGVSLAMACCDTAEGLCVTALAGLLETALAVLGPAGKSLASLDCCGRAFCSGLLLRVSLSFADALESAFWSGLVFALADVLASAT